MQRKLMLEAAVITMSRVEKSVDATGSIVLDIIDLSKRFGGVEALSDYCLQLSYGELLGLIGPNGAGKTTVFNLLSSVIRPSSGKIIFQGQDITNLAAHRFAALGIARTFQNIRLFRELTVLENVMAGLHKRHGVGLLATLLGLPIYRQAERRIQDKAQALLDLLDLADLGQQRAAELAYGDQRRVEIARALATEPRVLLLDEPAAGMNPRETDELVQMISTVHRDFQLTVILVEHDMRLVMGLCQRIQVINRGRFLAIGTPEEIQTNPAVIEAYLGTRRRKVSPLRRGRFRGG